MKKIGFFLFILSMLISKPDFAQKYGATPEDSLECVKNISLYREFYNQKNYKDAYKPWTKVIEICPQSSKNNFIRGAYLLKYRFAKNKDAELRKSLLDSLMMLYDKRIKYFGQEGYVLGRKGVDLIMMSPGSYEEAFGYLKKSVELEGMDASSDVLSYYMQTAVEMEQAGKIEKEEILDIYDKISVIAEHNIKKEGSRFKKGMKIEKVYEYLGKPSKTEKMVTEDSVDADQLVYDENTWISIVDSVVIDWKTSKESSYYTKIYGNYEVARENNESFATPYLTCPDIVAIYGKKYEENKEDVEVLKKITKLLEKKNCIDEALFFKTTQSLHSLEPTAQSAYLMGTMTHEQKRWNEAIKYFEEAAESFEEKDDKAKSYYMLADSYRRAGQFSSARAAAYKSLEFDADNGKPYLLIGDMYAASANSCLYKDDLKVAYWAAIDKFVKAKSVDPALTSQANSRIYAYRARSPRREELFFYNLNPGDPINVGCWIGESTTVRSSD